MLVNAASCHHNSFTTVLWHLSRKYDNSRDMGKNSFREIICNLVYWFQVQVKTFDMAILWNNVQQAGVTRTTRNDK